MFNNSLETCFRFHSTPTMRSLCCGAWQQQVRVVIQTGKVFVKHRVSLGRDTDEVLPLSASRLLLHRHRQLHLRGRVPTHSTRLQVCLTLELLTLEVV